jgi:WD40 repeat protein/energy-coupling factor transporter ATP-binding protein EcfA2
MTVGGESFNPFPGFRSYEVDEDYLFFGREEAIDELLRKLRQHRFVAVVGASGSGKSSLVRAGMIQALHGGSMVGDGAHWRVAVMRPGNDPVGQLARSLEDPEALGSADDPDPELSLDITAATLRRSRRGIAGAFREARLPEGTNLLILADQFEELFRYGCTVDPDRGDEAATFVELLLAATREAGVRVHVVLTLRSDFVGECTRFVGLAEAINDSQYLIPRLTRPQLAAAITGPARVGGAEISAPLLQRLLNDVGNNPDHLPVLQHALMRTFDRWLRDHRDGEAIGIAHYGAIGGMEDALSRHADEVFRELPERLGPIVERVFKCLMVKEEGGRGIRRPTTQERICAISGEAPDDVAQVVEAFGRPGRAFLTSSTGMVLQPHSVIDISHESLMRVGVRLRAWVGEEAAAAHFYRRLANTAALWKADKAGLWRNPELDLAERWQEDNRPNAPWAERYGGGFDQAMEFLHLSAEAWREEQEAKAEARRRELEQTRALAEAEHEKRLHQQRAARRLRHALVGVLLLLALAVASALWAVAERREMARAEISALSDSAHSLADLGRGIDSLTAALTAVDQLRAYPGTPPESSRAAVEVALTHALYSTHERNRWRAHGSWINTAVWSPNGELLVSAGYDPVIRLWRPDGTGAGRIEGDGSPVFALAVRDGLIAVGSGSGALGLWRRDLTRVGVFPAHAGGVRAVAFHPDGGRLASGGNDGAVRLWTVQGRQVAAYEAAASSDRGGPVTSLAFTPEGRLLAGYEDGTIRQLGVDLTPEPVARSHAASVNSLAVDPSGRYLVSGGSDGRVRLWSTAGGGMLWEHSGETPILAVSFSPDGKVLAAAGTDRRILLWRAPEDGRTGHLQSLATLVGHNEPVTALSFGPGGRLLSASNDLTLEIWQLDNGLLRTLLEHHGTVWTVAFDADGETVASGGSDGAVDVWHDGVLRQVLTGHQQLVRDVTFSPDGAWLASASHDGTARLRRLVGGTVTGEPVELRPCEAGINEVAFSSDSRHVVTVCLAGTADLWTLDGRREGEFREPGGLWGAVFALGGILTASPDGVVRLRAVDGGDLRRQWRTSDLIPVLRAVASSDGRRIAASRTGQGFVDLWRADGTLVGHLPHGSEGVNGIAFSPDGRWLATAGADGALRLWQAKDGRLLRVLRGHDGGLTDVAFSPDGTALASSGFDGTVRLWTGLDLDLDQLEARAKTWLRDYRDRSFEPSGKPPLSTPRP